MGAKPSFMLQDEEITLISEETGFSPAQIERLYERFKSLDKSGICGSLSREDFLRVPELAINPLCDRIVHMFFVDCDDDHDRINFRQFIDVLATFSSSNKPARSRQISRQESIQNIFNELSEGSFLHSKHSSCDDFLNHQPVHHHTTNQHSIHYVASVPHLAQHTASSYANSVNNNSMVNNHSDPNSSLSNNANSSGNSTGLVKKPSFVTTNHHHHHPHHHHHHHHHHHSKSNLLDPEVPVNSREKKLQFMFKIYDVDDDDRISLEDLKQILRTMVGNYISDFKLTEMALKTLKQVDRNGDGYIDFDEFCSAFLHRDIDEHLRIKFSSGH